MRVAHQAYVLFGALFAAAFSVHVAHAQANRTWVSGVGDDVNPCSRTAPCKTFAGAISKTALNGEINCLDPAGYGAVTITKSITIDCHEMYGSILSASTNGINIPFDSFNAANEVRRTVRLRNLVINAADTGLNGIRITGAATETTEVFIEDVLIDGVYGGNLSSPGAQQRAVSDERTGGGKLFVSNTTVRNNGGSGIAVIGGAGRLDVTLSNVRSQKNSNAGFVVTGNTKATVVNSVFSNNARFGVYAEGNGALVVLDKSVSNANGTGLFTGSGGAMRVGDSTIALNATAATGAWTSFGNNRVTDNDAAGTAPTPVAQQ